MRDPRLVLSLVTGLCFMVRPVAAQRSELLWPVDCATPGTGTCPPNPPRPFRLGQSSQVLLHDSGFPADRLRLSQSSGNHRVRNAVIGGLIGTATGLVVCTVISNISKDAGDTGLSTCTTKGYLLLGGSGLVLGAIIGYAIE